MNASEIINISLKTLMRTCENKGIQKAYEVIKSAVSDLYTNSCDDETWMEMCKVLMHMAFDICENESKEFTVSYYRNTVTVRFKNADFLRPDPLMSFTYPEVLDRPRESWDRHFMRSAYKAANRTTCRAGRKVGTQFARNKVPLMSGFNGVPASYPHPKVCKRVELGCKTGEGLHLCPCNHAEINAISMAAREGVSLMGSTMYVTSRPCGSCMGALTVLRPERIIYDDVYDGKDEVTEIAKHANIELIRLVDMT